ncbi:MAG: phosphoadenylyl-sulfate reductase [Cyclobacteriaceae bacterium]|nr:phosphoadenylyl-sulfate reductase [Cyclobacteriaceae bacterium]
MMTLVQELNEKLAKSGAEAILSYFLNAYKGKIVFGTSLGAEDQVITDMISRIDKSAKIFTLDTGRVFPETYETLHNTNSHYGINIEVYFPNSESVERMVNANGINLFYKNVENRKLCCQVRKIEPLMRAMTGAEIWITGIRREQSVTRILTEIAEYDEANKIIKVNPLVDWTEEDVWSYIREFNVPYNALHDSGFPSIGCQPCTRAIMDGEDVRAGRWWWETPDQKECGLHKRKNGQTTV